MGVTPHICQIAALSTITRRRFIDWMADFGIDLTQIPLRQIQMQRERALADRLQDLSQLMPLIAVSARLAPCASGTWKATNLKTQVESAKSG
jgi:type 1 fimbria pilin